MEKLFSIRAREITYRMVIVLCMLVTAVSVGFSLYYANSAMEEAKRNIYVLKNDKALIKATSTDFGNSYDILVRGQIEEINNLIFQQVPDPDNINKRLKSVEILGDRSVVNVLDILKQSNYYENIVNQNYFTLLVTDSIKVNYSFDPHVFDYYGKIKIVRSGRPVWRDIRTQGEIEATGITTEEDNRGFLIKRMKIVN